MKESSLLKEYFDVSFLERPLKQYNFDFLSHYIPNTTFFLSASQRKILHETVWNALLSTEYYSSHKRLFETLLIDISYASSFLEGNTYSYFDTEVLIKYSESAEGKTTDETAMIINHKNALTFLMDQKNNTTYSADIFYEIHKRLGRHLLPDPDLGIIRKRPVKIGGSTYTPLDNPQKLLEEFQLFLAKIRLIKNPFEQSVFIGIFIPYFQLFLDINKRTSRVSMNLPLIINGLPLISLLGAKQGEYFRALLAVYELQNYELFTDFFVTNYLQNMSRYIA